MLKKFIKAKKKCGDDTSKSGASEVERRSTYNQHYNAGRRELFGLSKAIREKAFQSTSPSSEAKPNCRNASKQVIKQEKDRNVKSTATLSIQEQLKNLLNSDTDGREKSNQKKSTLTSTSQTRSKTPVPHQKSKNTDGDVVAAKTMSYNDEDEYTISNRQASHHHLSSQHYHDQSPAIPPRRCPSTTPAMPENRERCYISPHNKYQLIISQSRVAPTPGVKPPRHQRKTSISNVPSRPTSTGPGFGGLMRRKMSVENKPVPALRKSLCYENSADPESARLVLEQSASFSDHPSMRLVSPARETPPISIPLPGTPHHCQSAVTLSPSPTEFQKSSHDKQLNSEQSHDLRMDMSVSTSNLRRCETPHPTNKKSYQFGRSPEKEPNLHPLLDKKPNRFLSPSQHKTRQLRSDYYPQQNSSFRRAVHRSVSSESEVGTRSDIKYQPKDICAQSPGDPRFSRKSDDRDSGAVVDAEASVFDFDSSVLTDEHGAANEIGYFNKSRSPNQVPNHQPFVSEETNDWPRLNFSLLSSPTLKNENNHFSPPWTERNHRQERQHFITRSSSFNQSSQVNKQRERSESPVKAARRISSTTANGAAELSLTESALNEPQLRKQEHNAGSKVISNKIQKGMPVTRRGIHSRSFVDEKKQSRNNQRHIFDDSDITDYSQQPTSHRMPVGRKSYQPSSYASCRTSSVNNDRSEFGETSSVLSITTTSVCSSLLRRTGYRSSSRRHILRAVDKYSREIRSVTKRFTRLETHVVTLARSLAQLSSDLRQQNVTSREIDDLRHQMEEIRARQMLINDTRGRSKSVTSTATKGSNQPKIKKLVKFFGEQPPLLNLFLKQLGYEKYIKNFECESIGMMELPYMDEKRLHEIGIPLGPRLRIMKEAQKSSYV